MMKAMKLIGMAAALTLITLGNAQAADVTAGKAKFSSCIACHGAQGQGMAIFPKLTGKTSDETAGLLQRYRAGETIGPHSASMMPQAAMLSDEDIANLSAYIATL